MKVAILQSSYIPWIGYFKLIQDVDIFVFYDSVQYSKNDFRNRNKIISNNGIQWLTIPVFKKLDTAIKDVRIAQNNWHIKHFKTIKSNYCKSINFNKNEDFLSKTYDEVAQFDYLTDINIYFLRNIIIRLGIKTKCIKDTDIDYSKDNTIYSENYPTNKIIKILKYLNASEYVSGAKAKNYLDVTAFISEDIKLTWYKYPKPIYKDLKGNKLNQNLSIWHNLLCSEDDFKDLFN